MAKTPHHTYEPWAAPPASPQALRVPGDLWALCKQIDELGGEWTYNLFLPRVTNFHFASLPVEFYEPLADFDRIAVEVLMADRARRSGLPEDEVGSVLLDFTAFPSLFNPVDGLIPMPSRGEHTIGRHTAGVLRVPDNETLVVRHGWSGWTPDHTAKMKRAFVDEYAKGAQVSRRWDRGPLASTVEPLLRASNEREFQGLWRTSRKRMSESGALSSGVHVNLSSFETWSLQSERPAEVLTLETRSGVRAGVAVLVHDDPDESSITDLFVWPPYRRHGFGTRLEGFAAQRAIARGSQNLAAYIWEADAIRSKDRASSFLQSLGYALEESQGTEYVMRATRRLE